MNMPDFRHLSIQPPPIAEDGTAFPTADTYPSDQLDAYVGRSLFDLNFFAGKFDLQALGYDAIMGDPAKHAD